MFSNRIKLGFIIGSVLLSNGCSMCCGVYDYDYPTYGGLVQRSDASHGRVGSVFSDPNAPVGVPAALGVEAVPEKSPARSDSAEDFDSMDDLEPLVPPQSETPENGDADKPAEELKEDLLKNMKTNAASTPPKRMSVRPVRMLQQANSQPAATPIRSAVPGRRILNLFQ